MERMRKNSMMKRFIIIPFILYGLLVLPFTMSAWGTSGHRIIGEMSQHLLDKKVNQKITAILGNASVAMISTWGDFIRSDVAYAGTDTWHYTNMSAEYSRAAFDTLVVKQDNGENVYRVIALIAHLKQQPNDTNMLKMLVHLVEDMHCPMHLGRPDDKGGNSIRFRWMGSEINLHNLWDDVLIDFQKLSYTEYAQHLMRTHKLRKVNFAGQHSLILDWAWQTYQATQIVYDSVEKTGNAYSYNFEYQSLLESRLIAAAEHLAAILNYIYK